MRTLIVIPARMASSRFPGKPLAKLPDGVALVDHVYKRAERTSAELVVVGTPDQEIMAYCVRHGMACLLTSAEAQTGTHRCAEVLKHYNDYQFDIVVNWQCDEPEIEPTWVDDTAKLCDDLGRIMTLACPTAEPDRDPNQVKAVVSSHSAWGRCHSCTCLWFSREWLPLAWLHYGVYAFPAATLRELSSLEPTPLSQAYSLEQLAWLEKGYTMVAYPILRPVQSVNVPDDILKMTL